VSEPIFRLSGFETAIFLDISSIDGAISISIRVFHDS